MGCGASRDAPVAATLTFVPRVEKERDDASLSLVQLKRLGLSAYDDFFTDFENGINTVVALNNCLFDAVCDVKAALSYAASPDPEYALDVELTTEGVRSAPQILLDVLFADGTRPQPLEVRHLLASRPEIADADRALGAAVQGLVVGLQVLPQGGAVRLDYDDSRQQLVVNGTGAAAVHQQVARVNAALAAFRRAAPGLRVLVTVIQTQAPGAGTFAWRLVPRTSAAAAGSTGQGRGAATAVSSLRPTATPLRVASAHGAGAIIETSTLVAQLAASVAAAVAATSAAATAAAFAAATAAVAPGASDTTTSVSAAAATVAHLRVNAGRRIDAVADEAAAAAAATAAIASAAAAAVPVGPPRGSIAALRTLSLTRPAAPQGLAAAVMASAASGVNAGAQADEATAVLRRAVTSANHALFRLTKCANAGASGGPEGAALRSPEGSGSAIVGALKLVLDATIEAARKAAAGASTPGGSGGGAPTSSDAADAGSRTVTGGAPSSEGGGGNGCAAGPLPVVDLVSAHPHVTVASENGSVNSNSTYSGVGTSSMLTARASREVGGGGGGAAEAVMTPGWSWTFDWGIEPRVVGVSFPGCLPLRARAVYDAVNAAVEAAQAATEQLPLVQREVQALVEESEAVFEKNDEKLVAAGRDMMTAGRMRAALDRNANTIAASPALVGLLQAAVAKFIDELSRGGDRVWAAVYGFPGVNGGSEPWDSGRLSGGRSIMAMQLLRAAMAAAAAAAAAAARFSADDSSRDGEDGEDEGYSTQTSTVPDSESVGASGVLSRGSGSAGVAGVARGVSFAADGGGGGGGGGGGQLRAALATGRARGGSTGVSRRVMLPPLPHGRESDTGARPPPQN